MGVNVKRGISLAILVMMMTILLNMTRHSHVQATSLKTNTTTLQCDGSSNECLVEDDMQVEFMMDSVISRMLADCRSPIPIVPQGPAFSCCRRNGRYTPCIAPDSNPGKNKQICKSVYNRNCG